MHHATQLLRDLVAIPAINPMGRPLTGPHIYEHAVTAYLEAFFKGLGVRHERQTIAPLRDNIVAFYEPPGATWTLVLEVHQDTVPTDNMIIDPFGATISDGRLWGRGACDVRGGMASMLSAFARLVREKPRSARVVMACTVDEEHTFLGVQRLAKDNLGGTVKGPVFAVVAEPTGLDIVHAHKGVARWSLTTAGRSCHSSRPELGLNAIYRMAEILPHVERYAEELRTTKSDPLLGPATLSVGRIEGGTSVNTVPDGCRIDIDRRVLPGEDPRALPAAFAEEIRRRCPQTQFNFTPTWLVCPALGPALSGELVSKLGVAIDSVRGKHGVVPVPYGTDASTLAEAGVASVVFGPGDIAQAHTCDEWVELAQVEAASEILYRLAIG